MAEKTERNESDKSKMAAEGIVERKEEVRCHRQSINQRWPPSAASREGGIDERK